MCKARIRIAIGLVVSIAFLTGNFSIASAFQAYTHTTLTGKVDDLFSEWDNMDSPGAALGIFKDGRIIYARGYGMANLEYDIPITPQTVFRTGSVSKQFTAMCIALLVEQGKVNLDEDIRTYVPNMPDFGIRVTVRHLVHHISGFRDYLTLQGLAGKGGDYFYTSEDLVDLLSRQQELNFEPGSEYLYSNSGYFLLSEIVKNTSGMNMREFARINIFEPLGMNNTHFHNDPHMVVKNRASGYNARRDGGYRISMTMLDMIGDGGVFTTIEDFQKWDENFYDNKLGKGSQDLIDMVLTKGVLNNRNEISYAFGLNVGSNRGLKTVSHGGSFVGFRAHFLQYPDQHFSVVIMTNNSISPGRMANAVAEIYLEDEFTEAPSVSNRGRTQRPGQNRQETIQLSTDSINRITGEYYSEELDVIYVLSSDNDNLFLKLGNSTNELQVISQDNLRWGNRNIELARDRQNMVTGFVLQAGRVQNLKFSKIK